MSDDTSTPTPARAAAPKNRSPLRDPPKVAGVDPPETDDADSEADARDFPRAARLLVLNNTDGVRPAVRCIPSGRDAAGSMQFDRRGSKNLVPGLNWVDADAWEDATYQDEKGKECRSPGLRSNLQLRIRAKEIEVIEPTDTAAMIRGIKLTATKDMLTELLSMEAAGALDPKKPNRKGVMDALEESIKRPERRLLG